MTNTFVLDGTDDPDDIVRDTEHGVYVAQLGGGQVNTATGDFVFGMTEAYLIENGEITEPLREGNLIGNGPQVLRDIDAVGNDFAMGTRARAARTARACRSATASRRCGSRRSPSAAPPHERHVPTNCWRIADRVVGHGRSRASRSRPSCRATRETERPGLRGRGRALRRGPVARASASG